MEIDEFQVHIEDRDFLFNSPAHEEKFRQFLNQFEGKKVGLKIIESKPSRSKQQNSYYWVYLNTISRETGHEKEDLHNLFKGKFLTDGLKDIFGEKVRSIKSTTNLSMDRFSKYLDQIEQLTGVELPDTTAYFGYSFHNLKI